MQVSLCVKCVRRWNFPLNGLSMGKVLVVEVYGVHVEIWYLGGDFGIYCGVKYLNDACFGARM